MPTRGHSTGQTVTGRIVRVIHSKNFGFIRLDDRPQDHFFHAEDYNGDWYELTNLQDGQFPKVTGVVVESAKGPRLADVTPIYEAQHERDGTASKGVSTTS